MECAFYKTSLGSNEVAEWDRMMNMLDDYIVGEDNTEDSFTWVFEKSRQYSTRSMYRLIFQRGH